MKIYDLSQPLNERSSFWPYYPPFEVKYIKRKAEHGVTAQYIMTSNHMGTHLDAPRHFVTAGKTIDELPLEWLCGPGAIVDLRDEMDELAVYTPQMIEKRVQVKPGDLLLLHTGWHRYADFGATPDEERYYHYHPGAHPDLVPWLLEKKIHVWGVDCVSTDHPMNLPIGRFLGKGAHGQCDKVRAKAEQKFGGRAAVDKMFPDSAYQLPHNALFPKDCIHRQPGRRTRGARAPEQAPHRRLLPVEVQRRRGGVLPHRGVHGGMEDLAERSATELSRLVRSREVSPVEVVEACLARVERFNPAVNAVVTLNPRALDDAGELELRLVRGEEVGLL